MGIKQSIVHLYSESQSIDKAVHYSVLSGFIGSGYSLQCSQYGSPILTMGLIDLDLMYLIQGLL